VNKKGVNCNNTGKGEKTSFMDNNDEGVKESKLELLAAGSFPDNPDLVYVVDFLNRSLKKKNVLFGIKKNKESNEMVINIYEV